MYFYIIPPVYVLAHLILFAVWNLWLSSASDRYRKNKKMHWVLLAAIVLASLPSLLGCFLPESRVQSSLAAIGNLWLGIFFYVGGISVLLAMFVSFPMFVYGRVSSGRGRGFWGVIGSILSSWKKVHRGLIIGTLLAALILNVYGIIHAVDIKVHEFTVSVDKPLVIDGEKKDSLKVVLIADLHMSVNSRPQTMQRMVDLINEQDADLVMAAGDFLTSTYVGLKNPETYAQILRQMKQWHAQGVTGVFSFCDVEAWSLITTLENDGSGLEKEFAIIGFDNILGYINFPKPICSIECHLQEEACTAIDLLRNRIHDPSLPPQQRVLPVSLVCRNTCRRTQTAEG